jgi:hypothetical protein
MPSYAIPPRFPMPRAHRSLPSSKPPLQNLLTLFQMPQTSPSFARWEIRRARSGRRRRRLGTTRLSPRAGFIPASRSAIAAYLTHKPHLPFEYQSSHTPPSGPSPNFRINYNLFHSFIQETSPKRYNGRRIQACFHQGCCSSYVLLWQLILFFFLFCAVDLFGFLD